MHRLVLLLSGFLLLAAILVTAARPSAFAQDAMTAHPVIGAWEFTNDLGEGIIFPTIGVFQAGGTYMEVTPDGGVLVGVWEPTGERTAAGTMYSNYIIDDKLVNGEGRWTVEVDETGNALVSTGTFIGLFEDGSVDLAVEGPSPAVRLSVLPVVPLGTPVIPADMTGEGTPTT